RAVGGDQSLLRLRIVMAGPADGDAFVRVRPALPPRAEADGGHFDVRSSESDLPHRRRILTGLRGADVSSAHVGTTEKPANGAGRADETSAPLDWRVINPRSKAARPSTPALSCPARTATADCSGCASGPPGTRAARRPPGRRAATRHRAFRATATASRPARRS